MSGHQPFSNLTANFSPERKANIAAQTEKLKLETTLNEVQQAFSLTQDELASKLNIKQPAISRLEKNSDMYLSHLREVIETMGGELVITARFQDNEVEINNFNFVRSEDSKAD